MASTTSRMAVFNREPFAEVVENSAGQSKLRGIRVLVCTANLFERVTTNITYVPVDGVAYGTPDSNGTYDGIYGAVQSGKADFSLFQIYSYLVNPPGEVTSAAQMSEYIIATPNTYPESSKMHPLKTMNALGTLSSAGVLLMFTLLLLLLWKPLGTSQFWRFYGMTWSQDFPHVTRDRLLVAAMLYLLTSVRIWFSGAFSTDVTILKTNKPINSLSELEESNLNPVWLRADPIVENFRHRVTKCHGKIWDRGVATNDQFLELAFGMSGHVRRMVLAKRAIMGPEFLYDIAKVFACKYSDIQNTVRNGTLNLFVSTPFTQYMWSYLINKDAHPKLKSQLHKLAKRTLEHKLMAPCWKDILNGLPLIEKNLECSEKITKRLKSEQSSSPLKLESLPVYEFFYALVFSLIVHITCKPSAFQTLSYWI